MIVPYSDDEKKHERKLGMLDGKCSIRFADDFKMTEEEFTELT